jgi:hypothetical protein
MAWRGCHLPAKTLREIPPHGEVRARGNFTDSGGVFDDHRANPSAFSSDALKVGPKYRATARWIFSDVYDVAFLFLPYPN